MISPEELSAIIVKNNIALVHKDVMFRVFSHMTSAHMLVIAPFVDQPASNNIDDPNIYKINDFMIDIMKVLVKENCSYESVENVKNVCRIFDIGAYNEINDFVEMMETTIAIRNSKKIKEVRNFARDHDYNYDYMVLIEAIIYAKHCPDVIFRRGAPALNTEIFPAVLHTSSDAELIIRIIRAHPPMIDMLFSRSYYSNQTVAYWRAIRTALGEDTFYKKVIAHENSILSALKFTCDPAIRELIHAAYDETATYPLFICTPTDFDIMIARGTIDAAKVLRDIDQVTSLTLFKHICKCGIINGDNCTTIFAGLIEHYQKPLFVGTNVSSFMRVLVNMYPTQPLHHMITSILNRPEYLFLSHCGEEWVIKMFDLLKEFDQLIVDKPSA
jgi:hypothetical protein